MKDAWNNLKEELCIWAHRFGLQVLDCLALLFLGRVRQQQGTGAWRSRASHTMVGRKQRRIDKGSLRCIFPGQTPGDLILQLSPAVGDGLSFPHLPIRSSLGTYPLVRSEPSWFNHFFPKLSSECCYPGNRVSTREPFRKHFISKPQE